MTWSAARAADLIERLPRYPKLLDEPVTFGGVFGVSVMHGDRQGVIVSPRVLIGLEVPAVSSGREFLHKRIGRFHSLPPS